MKQVCLEKISERTYKIKFFITISKPSAIKYAKKAAQQFGGEAIIYTVKPEFSSLIKKGTEYICNKAFIKSFEKI